MLGPAPAAGPPPFNLGPAQFVVQGALRLGSVLQPVLVASDPNGNGSFVFEWTASSPGSGPVSLGFGPTLSIGPSLEGRRLGLRISYVDRQGFFESLVLDAGVVPVRVNDGSAVFQVNGSSTVGSLLRAELLSSDPDGNGAFSYQWQSSSDGSTWVPVGEGASYGVTSADQGRLLRVRIQYTDQEGFAESLLAWAGQVPFLPPPEVQDRRVVGSNSVRLSAYAADRFESIATLSQGPQDRSLLAIGMEACNIDLADGANPRPNRVSILASVVRQSVSASAIGMLGSRLQLRSGDDDITVTAQILGVVGGESVAMRDSFLSANRGDDTLTLRGESWGDRAIVFGGDGNDRITGYGIGRDSFIQAGSGDDIVSLGRLETTPGALPLVGRDGRPLPVSTYRGGEGFDVLQLRDTTQAVFEAEATWFSTAAESGWLFRGARFSGFEQISFG